MANSVVGIIVPVYNTEDCIAECFDSILLQTYKNLRIIVVDDGSNDNSIEIANSYSEKDMRFSIYKLQHAGVSHARNYGIDICLNDETIDFITFVDSDDIIKEDYVETLIKAKEKYNTRISCCSIRMLGGKKPIGTYQTYLLSKEDTLSAYFEDRVFFESPCLKLVDKEVYRGIRFNEGKRYEDTFICYRLIEEFDKFAYVDYCGYYNRSREGSATRSELGDHSYDKIEACKEIYEFYKNSKFKKQAFNKYVGSLLYFIIKTNSNRKNVSKNKIALKEFKRVIFSNGIKILKPIFIPFAVLSYLNMLPLIGDRFLDMAGIE